MAGRTFMHCLWDATLAHTGATLPHYSQPVMPHRFGVVALPPGHLEWAVALPPARLVASPSNAPLYRCLWNASLRRLFLAVVGFLAPGSLTSRHAVSPTKNSTRSPLVCSTWVTSGPLRVEFSSDNQPEAVVSSLRKGSCRCSNVMSLLRRLFLVAALQNFSVSASYVEGVANGITDSLSRQDFNRFRTLGSSSCSHFRDTTRPLPNILGEPSLVPCTSTHSNQPQRHAGSTPLVSATTTCSAACIDVDLCQNRDLSTSQRTTMASTNHHFFEHKNGEALSQAHLTSVAQRLLERDGCRYTAAFKGHSYRSGTATTAAEAVVPDLPFMTMGR